MKFDYEGVEYDITFNYDFVESVGCGALVRATTCVISSVDPTQEGAGKYMPVAWGLATQHVRDQFCKATGRKVALSKAISCFMINTVKYARGTTAHKKVRRRIWEAYFAQCDLKTTHVNKKELRQARWNKKVLKEADTWK